MRLLGHIFERAKHFQTLISSRWRRTRPLLLTEEHLVCRPAVMTVFSHALHPTRTDGSHEVTFHPRPFVAAAQQSRAELIQSDMMFYMAPHRSAEQPDLMKMVIKYLALYLLAPTAPWDFWHSVRSSHFRCRC